MFGLQRARETGIRRGLFFLFTLWPVSYTYSSSSFATVASKAVTSSPAASSVAVTAALASLSLVSRASSFAAKSLAWLSFSSSLFSFVP